MTYKAFPTAAEIYCDIDSSCVAKLEVEDGVCIVNFPKGLVTTSKDWAHFSEVVAKAIEDLRLEDEP